MSLFLYKNACSSEVIEVLHELGISKSYDAILGFVKDLSEFCIQDARLLAHSGYGYMFGYDNINISTSTFVEQRTLAPSKVQSGTHAIIYPLLRPRPAALCLAPIVKRAKHFQELKFEDIAPSSSQMDRIMRQFKSHLVRILCCRHPSFKHLQKHPAFQPESVRPLPRGYRTQQFPLRISTIEESTITGNIAVHVDTHEKQLMLTHQQLSDMAIFSVNDQATNARVRGAKLLRAKDVNPFTRCECLQLGIGLFHLGLNLIWVILHVHRGTQNQEGSLAYWFTILEKTRLGSAHPDYHTLLATLQQIFDGEA